MMPVLTLTYLASLVTMLLALQWDRNDRTKQLERLEGQLEQLQSRVNAVQRALDERQKRGRVTVWSSGPRADAKTEKPQSPP